MSQVIERTTRLRAAAMALALMLMAGALAAAGPLDRPARASSAPEAHAGQPLRHFIAQGLYRGTAVYNHQAWSWYQPTRLHSWIAPDGSGRQRTLSGKPWFASQEDRAIWEAAGKPRFLAQGFRPHNDSQTLPPGSFDELLYSPQPAAEMPAAPAALADWLLDLAEQPTRGGGNGFEPSVKTLELVTELLRNPALSTAQRLALYEAGTSVEGVEVLGSATDAAGREGTAIAAESANSGALTRYSIVVDEASGRILESEALRLAPLPYQHEWDGPQLESRTTYLQDGVASPGASEKKSRKRSHHR